MTIHLYEPDGVGVVMPEQVGVKGQAAPGQGFAGRVAAPPWWRGSSFQVCGLWPFTVGIESPIIGAPLGRNLVTGSAVCCDPIAWFEQAKLMNNPSMFVFGLPGYGKSTLIRHMVTGMVARGVIPLFLGDLKPDYAVLTDRVEGSVIRLGRGRGYLNVLDPGDTWDACARLRTAGYVTEAEAVRADAHGRSLAMVEALIGLLRRQPPSGHESSILDAVLKHVAARGSKAAPLLQDVLAVLRARPDSVRAVVNDHGDDARYVELTDALETTLIGLVSGSRVGEMFSRPTSARMDRGRALCFDVSGIPESETDLAAASLLACWSAGFAAINLSQVLADVGLEPRRNYVSVLDEMWRVLGAGSGMVDRVNAVTRLNRQEGTGLIECTHTIKDLLSLSDRGDREKAKGLAERAGLLACGGLPPSEMPLLQEVREFTKAEQNMMVSWQTPGAMDKMGRASAPPGQGRFMLKLGGRPGIPVRVDLTPAEVEVSDTNRRWNL